MKSLRFTYVVLACLIAATYFLCRPHVLIHEERPKLLPTKLLFVGDMMFDRTIRTVGEKKGYGSLFSCLDPYLKSFDLVVGNLEGPITFADSVSVGTNPGDAGNTSFSFSPLVGYTLAEHNVRAVSLGNNHILDRGREGVESTRRVLEDDGILYFGAPGSDVATTTMVNGREIGLVNFNQFLGENNPERTVAAIKALKTSVAFVAVYAHWGEEYVSETDKEKIWARSFVDAGADLVIGSHPHIVQKDEVYKGKHIYYSLGNFIFDQYFNPKVSQGMGVEVLLGDDIISLTERLFTMGRDGITCLIEL